MRRSDRSRSRSRSPARKRGRSPSPPPPASTQRQWATDRIDESDEVRARRVAQQLERLKKGREERQKAALERQQSQGGGGGDGEFAYQEAAFHVSQAKLRAEKRVQDGRGKLLDLLVILAHPSIPLPPGTVVPRPSRLFRRLPAADKSELQAELPILHSADEEGREVWEAAAMLLRGDPGAEGMHSTILPDVDALLSSLEGQGLEELQAMVESEARRGDEEYWGALLRRLKRRQAEAVLERRHALWFQSRPEEEREAIQSALDAPEVEEEEVAAEAEEEEDVMEEEETHRPRRPNVRSLTAEELWKREKERGMTQDEEQFQQEFEGTPAIQAHLQDKSLKKPLSYNRVRSGVEWHHYNRSHYDADNPPPKTTFGYEFNIFYPNLPDGVTPQFVLHKTADPDLVVIEFKAAAPYRNIAFKIVQGEWDRFPHMGYKCLYSHHTLQLHFNYRRFQYRR